MNTIYYLTGRATFKSDTLGTPNRTDYESRNPVVEEFRDFMQFSRLDYFTFAALAAMRDAAPVTRGIMDSVPALSATPEEFYIAGAEPIPDVNGNVVLNYFPDTADIETTWRLRRLSYDTVSLRPKHRGDAVTLDYSYNADTGIANIEWPDNMQFPTAIKIIIPWIYDTEIEIFTPPASYPYKAIADAIEHNVRFIRLMQEEGTLAYFESATDDLVKVAAMCTAVVMSESKANLHINV